jgi:amidase
MPSSLLSLLAAAATASAAAVASGTNPLFALTPNLIPSQEDAGTDKLFPMGNCFGFKLEEATIDEMQKAMQAGNLTSVQLVTCYMTRTFQTQQYIK